MKKNSTGTFFFLLESLLSLAGITCEIEKLLSIKNWCGIHFRGSCKECLIGLGAQHKHSFESGGAVADGR